MKIAYLDPVPEWAKLELLTNELSKFTETGTEVVYECLDEYGTDNYEYLTYEAMMIPEVLRKIKNIEKHYDAVILGCFLDPGLEAVKEFVADTIVVGPAEASVTLANLLGRKFSVICVNDKNVPQIEDVVYKYTKKERLASVRTLDLRVTEIPANPEHSNAIMKKEIECAIEEDHAEVIVLGCTLEAGHFAELQREFNVPIIDPTVAALRMAEYRVKCKELCGWDISRICSYKQPDEEEWRRYKL